jgi:hypothetical protein
MPLGDAHPDIESPAGGTFRLLVAEFQSQRVFIRESFSPDRKSVQVDHLSRVFL